MANLNIPKEMVTQVDFEKFVDAAVKKSKVVLTIGETNMDFEKAYRTLEDWRFKRLHQLNNNIIGLDIVNKNIERAKKLGYDFRKANVENKEDLKNALGDAKFDLIIMLGVIEHLSELGTALGNLRNLLADGGKIIITTNTPYYFRDLISMIFLRRNPDIYYDHTCFIMEGHMRVLGEKVGLKLFMADTLHMIKLKGIVPRMIFKIIKFYNKIFLNSYIFVLELE